MRLSGDHLGTKKVIGSNGSRVMFKLMFLTIAWIKHQPVLGTDLKSRTDALCLETGDKGFFKFKWKNFFWELHVCVLYLHNFHSSFSSVQLLPWHLHQLKFIPYLLIIIFYMLSIYLKPFESISFCSFVYVYIYTYIYMYI